MNEKKLLFDLLNKRKKFKSKNRITFKINNSNYSLFTQYNESISSNSNKTKNTSIKKNTYKTVANSSSKENVPFLQKNTNLVIE